MVAKRNTTPPEPSACPFSSRPPSFIRVWDKVPAMIIPGLITYPMLQTHTDVLEAQREAKGVNNQLLRLSVGLEDCGDLIADLEQAVNE